MIFVLIFVVFLLLGAFLVLQKTGGIDHFSIIPDDKLRYATVLENKCYVNNNGEYYDKFACVRDAVKMDFKKIFGDEERPDCALLYQLFQKYGINVPPQKYFWKAHTEMTHNMNSYIFETDNLLSGISETGYNHNLVTALLSNLVGRVHCLSFVRGYNSYMRDLENLEDPDLKNLANVIGASTTRDRYCLDIAYPDRILKYNKNASATDILDPSTKNINIIIISMQKEEYDDDTYHETDHANGIYLDHERKLIYHYEPHGEIDDDFSMLINKLLVYYVGRGYSWMNNENVGGVQDTEYDEGFCTMWSAMMMYLMYMNKDKEPGFIVAAIEGMSKESVASLLSIFMNYATDSMNDIYGTDLYMEAESIVEIELTKGLRKLDEKIREVEDKYAKRIGTSNVLQSIKNIRSNYSGDTLSDLIKRYYQVFLLSRLLDNLMSKGVYHPNNRGLLSWLNDTEEKKTSANCAFL